MNIAIIGGGAAGLMAAATIAELGTNNEITLIERNSELGRKVTISGGGRCNLTTGLDEPRDVLKRYPRGAKFLTSAMFGFPPPAVRSWFVAHGVPVKIEEDNRAFPVSNDGHDVVGAFEDIFRTHDVHVMRGTSVTSVRRENNKFIIEFSGKRDAIIADRLIITTGGQAYRDTGSTGDGYAFAQALGHTLTALHPSLSNFIIKENWPKELSGVSLVSAKLSAPSLKAEFTGPMLFTHRGITGPAVFALSAITAGAVVDMNRPLEILIDLFPAEKTEDLVAMVRRLVESSPRAHVRNQLPELGLMKSLTAAIWSELKFPADRRGGDFSMADTKRLVEFLKHVPITATGRGVGEEFVTAGGIPNDEVNPSTMESKIVPGLFFAGEILDVDGFTGGFNLQAAWCTGHLAGIKAAQ